MNDSKSNWLSSHIVVPSAVLPACGASRSTQMQCMMNRGAEK